MNRLILSIFLASSALAPLSVQAACGDAERSTDVFRAFDGCDKIRAAKKANGALTELITAFAQTGYCQTVTDRTPVDAKWKEVC